MTEGGGGMAGGKGGRAQGGASWVVGDVACSFCEGGSKGGRVFGGAFRVGRIVAGGVCE